MVPEDRHFKGASTRAEGTKDNVVVSGVRGESPTNDFQVKHPKTKAVVSAHENVTPVIVQFLSISL
jgi:hypothetical protein